MPLPVAHSLMGYTIGESTRLRLARNFWINALFFAVLANFPDIDFFPGFLVGNPNLYHHHQAHSIGFVVLWGLVVGAVMWVWQRRFWSYFWLATAAVGSHLVLDLLTQDFSEPHGMMLLWPLTAEFYDLPWKIFLAVHKSDHSADFLSSLLHPENLRVIKVELALMLPLAALATFKRYWVRRTQAPTKAGRRRASAQSIESTLVWKTRRQNARLVELESASADQPWQHEHSNLNQPRYRNGKR